MECIIFQSIPFGQYSLYNFPMMKFSQPAALMKVYPIKFYQGEILCANFPFELMAETISSGGNYGLFKSLGQKNFGGQKSSNQKFFEGSKHQLVDLSLNESIE